MTMIYLVRHGQTLFNLQHKIQGFCDSPLTNLGVEEAKIAGRYFKEANIPLDEAFVSTSERAIDTLQLITDLPFKTHKNLREWNFGTYEGEGEHLNPPLPYGDFFVQFGGESQTDLTKRINQAVTDIAKHSNKQHILIVSHGASIANFYREWEEFSPVKRHGSIKNCSIMAYEYLDDTFISKEIINHDFSNISLDENN
ncbi:histidine phosphatase family protein [Vagococcus jeotgali]|uniref:histidine phosphatase family protein n=1 Tax=Vagococcus jeotgali TaxID=3109030 RepID=UPI002DDC4A8D|nr:histidine phosphatase family protein [Vagococcus sp. B2T-5]